MALTDYAATIRTIEDLSPTVRLFTFDLDKEFNFKPGQFVNLAFESEGKNYIKPYSIASNPIFENSFQLCIKLVENGQATPKLWQKKAGDKLNIKGPFGIFTTEKSQKEKMIFIGTGTGIAPLRSMIQSLLSKGTQKEITLVFGCRYENELLLRNEFEKYAKENSNFNFIPIVSRPSDEWQGRTGHVQDNFDCIDIPNCEAYLCGLPLMVEGAIEKLKKMGMNDENIHHEKFT